MKCVHCGKSPSEHGVSLYRQNPKGEVGVWACEVCNQKPVDPEVLQVVADVEGLQLPPNKFRMH